MNGDGTGRALGVNDPALGWTLFGVFSLVWALWYSGQKDLGDFDVSRGTRDTPSGGQDTDFNESVNGLGLGTALDKPIANSTDARSKGTKRTCTV